MESEATCDDPIVSYLVVWLEQDSARAGQVCAEQSAFLVAL
jgi:hypothetical protein